MPKSHEDLGKDSVLVKGKCPKNVMMCIYKFFHYFINFTLCCFKKDICWNLKV